VKHALKRSKMGGYSYCWMCGEKDASEKEECPYPWTPEEVQRFFGVADQPEPHMKGER